MTRRAFYSFHYKPDNWRASQVRNMGVIEGNRPVTDNDWEEVKRGGDRAIKSWIDSQLKGKSVLIVLIGENTAGRKWINYEIERAWKDRKGILGIYIHNLKDSNGYVCLKGKNPFTSFSIGNRSLSNIVKVYDPKHTVHTTAYNSIRNNLSTWIEEAIKIREQY